MSTEVEYLTCGTKQVRIPQNATQQQIELTYKRLAWMVHHNGLSFPAELDRQLRDNGLMRRNRGKKNKGRQAVHIEVTPDALLLIDLGNSFKSWLIFSSLKLL